MKSHSPLNLVFLFHIAVTVTLNLYTPTSSYTSKHHFNFMLVTELERGQNNIIAKHLETVFSSSQHLFVASYLTPTPFGASYENHSHKNPASVRGTFFSTRGCLLTRASTL